MSDYGRRIVVDLPFEDALGVVRRAVGEQGLEVIARVDVRDRFRRGLAHDFRRYFLFEVWSPELALEALRQDLDAGTILPTTIAVYELADGETAISAREPLLPLAAHPGWRQHAPALAAMADDEAERVARALETMTRGAGLRQAAAPAA
jgi:uncharacterized protein (DUF302 family)